MAGNDFIKKFNAKLDEAIKSVEEQRMEDDRRRLLSTVGQDIAQMLAPFLEEVAKSAKSSKEDIRDVMFEILGEVNNKEMTIDTKPITDAIEKAMMNVRLPEPKVTYTAPPIKIPDLKMPDEMNIKGWAQFMGMFRDYDNPIPVQLRDHKGNPLNLFEGLTQVISGGGGGGGFRIVSIDDIRGSLASLIDQVEGALKVTGTVSVAASNSSVHILDASNQIFGSAANPLNVAFSALSSQAAALIDSSGVQYSGSNPLPITIVSGSSAGREYEDAGDASVGGGGLAMAKTGAGSTYALRLGTGDSVTALRTVQAVDALSSINVMQVGGNTIDTGAGASSSGSIRTVLASDSMLSTITSTDAVATQVLPAMLSKNFGFNGSTWDRIHTGTGDSAGAMRVTFATDASASVAASQVGTWTITSITNSVQATLIDSSGVGYSGSNPVPITWVSGAGPGTTAAVIVDSGGVQYSGSNPVPVTMVSSSLASTIVVGDVVSDAADTGSAPEKIGGIARTANPTAVANGDRVSATFDDLGRQLNRPVQVRDLMITAYASQTNGTEQTLLAASAGSFHDLVYIMASNNSDAAVTLDVRPVTGGNIVMSIQVPANGVAGVACPVPYPQSASDSGNNWTIDMPDITGTTVYVSALFSREV